VLTVMAFGPDSIQEAVLERPEDLSTYLGRWPVVWLNVDGLGDVDIVRRIGEVLRMHPLAVEDVVDTSQRPKLDVYPEGTFIVLRSAELHKCLVLEQISLFIGEGVVVSFQEMPGDNLHELRDRIRKGRGRVRRSPPAYLGYVLCDAIIDGYFVILEQYGDELEGLEQRILARPHPELLARLFEIKRELLAVRRVVWPMRDVAAQLGQESTGLGSDVQVYARDAQDHAARIIDLVESFRELASSMVDIYLANLSNQMNQIIKVLTIISTICIPLSVIAGIYGMNFDVMPELHWRFGYPMVLGAMALLAGVMVTWFWRQGWIGRRELPPAHERSPTASDWRSLATPHRPTAATESGASIAAAPPKP